MMSTLRILWYTLKMYKKHYKEIMQIEAQQRLERKQKEKDSVSYVLEKKYGMKL